MKTITVTAQAVLDQYTGTEPILIVEIEWDAGSITRYGDKSNTTLHIEGRLLSVGNIESILKLDNKQTDSVELTLDDTDGFITEIINTKNIHKIPCRVYQYYGQLSSLSDRILIFDGQISSPFTWGESDRSVQFTVVSELESFEVGFSPEEGQLDFVNQEFIGKAWPLGFGEVVHVPAARVHQALTGELTVAIGIIDPILYWQINRLAFQYVQAEFLMLFYQQMMADANYISRPVRDILADFIQIIKEERQVALQILNVRERLETMRHEIEGNPAAFGLGMASGEEAFEALVRDELNPLATTADAIAVRKNKITTDDNNNYQQHQQGRNMHRGEISLAEYEYEIKTHAAQQQVVQYNNMLKAYAEYVYLAQEICRQGRNVRTSFRIIGGQLFPQAPTIVDIYVNNMGYRGTFTNDVFTVLAGPFAKYRNIPVAEWVTDDDACAPTDETNGVAVFYLDGLEPPKNLVGNWLLVKKRGEPSNFRHVIKVIRQEGRKIIFELREWQTSANQPTPTTLDTLIKMVVTMPIIPTSFFGGIPTDLFTGNVDPEIYQRPEVEYLKNIIASLATYGGINHDEFQALAKLSFLLPLDELGDDIIFAVPTARDVFTIIGTDVERITEVAGSVLQSWLDNYSIYWQELPESLEWTAQAGSNVRLTPDDCQIYIANILPSTIHAVHAYRTERISGRRYLAPVPTDYYIKKENANLGTINVTALVFPIALTSIAGEQWEEEIYVTYTSSIGTRITDIIEYLVTTYVTGGTIDAPSFAAIDAQFADRYPASFALLDRPNVLDEIARIAFESRCAIYRRGSKFFLKYLSLEPTEDTEFTLANIKTQSLKVTYTMTEELVTRLIAYYQPNYLPLENHQLPYKIVLRNNVRRYNVHTREENFHIYNNPDLVVKTATFWLIRWSNTWKQIDFQMFLRDLPLDVLDTIKFTLGKTFFATEDSTKGVIRSIVQDPITNLLTAQVWLPIRAGEMETYIYAWPAGLPEDTAFPDIEEGMGGGFGPGHGVEGTIDGC